MRRKVRIQARPWVPGHLPRTDRPNHHQLEASVAVHVAPALGIVPPPGATPLDTHVERTLLLLLHALHALDPLQLDLPQQAVASEVLCGLARQISSKYL